MNRIIVLGDLNLDIAASLPGGLPRGGEVRTMIRTSLGGSAANFARTFARHEGTQVVFIGCVGDDPAGRILVAALVEQGVEACVKQVPIATGTIISLTDGADRTMLCSRGANDGLDESFIDPSWFEGADHLHLSGYALLSPGQARAAERAAEIASDIGISISIGAPPANLIRNVGVENFLSAAAVADWLFLNHDEGKVLTGAETPDEIVDALAEPFGVGALTLGRAGSIAWAGSDRDRSALEPIESADTTGAGDAFAAGFVAEFLEHRDLARANRHALEVARSLLRGRITPV